MEGPHPTYPAHQVSRPTFKYHTPFDFSTASQESSSVPANSSLKTSSSYLRQYPYPLEIIEILPTASPPPLFDAETSNLILTADITIVVCNPLTTSPSAVLLNPLLRDNPDVILILTCTPPSHMAQTLQRSIGSSPLHGPKIVFVDPTRAACANEILKSGPRIPSIVQNYQNEFVSSRVSVLTAALRERLSSSAHASLRDQTSLTRIRVTLSILRGTLERAQSEINSVFSAISRLRQTLEEAKVDAQRETFSRPTTPHSMSTTQTDAIAYAFHQARMDTKLLMQHLTWWRMLWNVDEISALVNQAVQKTWFRDFKKQVCFLTIGIFIINSLEADHEKRSPGCSPRRHNTSDI